MAAWLAPSAYGQTKTLRLDSVALSDPPVARLSDPVLLLGREDQGKINRIVQTVLQPSGNVHFLDGSTRQLVSVDTRTSHVAVFSLPEGMVLNQPVQIATARDTLLVVDLVPMGAGYQAALRFFSFAGRYLGTTVLTASATRGIIDLRGHAAGWLIRYIQAGAPPSAPYPPRSGPYHDTYIVGDLNPSTGEVNTRATFSSAPRFAFESGIMMTQAMAHTPSVALAADGSIYSAPDASYTVNVLESGDDSISARVVAEVTPPVFTPADFEVFLASRMAEAKRRGRSAQGEALITNARWLGHASVKSMLGEILPSSDGRFFVQRLDLSHAATSKDAGLAVWDLLDLEEGILGRLEVPADVRLIEFQWPYVCVVYGGEHGNMVSRYTVVIDPRMN